LALVQAAAEPAAACRSLLAALVLLALKEGRFHYQVAVGKPPVASCLFAAVLGLMALLVRSCLKFNLQMMVPLVTYRWSPRALSD
jgi:hypothetical protein